MPIQRIIKIALIAAALGPLLIVVGKTISTVGTLMKFISNIGEDIYYVLYSNGRLLLRGTGATYDYDLGESPF